MILDNKNKIELIGKITSLSYEYYDINKNKFMFFDIVQNNKINDLENSSSFYKIKLSSEMILKYKDIVKISNNVYINGYLNTYQKEKRNIYYIYPKEIKLLDNNYKLENGTKEPTISYDTDGVMLWNGTRCEATPPTEEELKEMKNLLSEYK